ncbi:MAG: alpha/beta hydrolase [Candidatus Accumulibacter sp.]|nr:alpha/beta hydrolase [Accumulibacter sp.]
MSQATILIVPGRGNSGPGHWQSIVEDILPDTRRVRQDDWDNPALDAWSRHIDRAVRALDRPPLLVAHSYGCLAAAHAQIALGTPVGATLFVAPADPERFGLPRRLFAERLARPGMLIASDSDPWLSLEQALALAAGWGVECVNLGRAGHINVASGHGRWPLGEAIVESMRAALDDAEIETPQRARHPQRPLGTCPDAWRAACGAG